MQSTQSNQPKEVNDTVLSSINLNDIPRPDLSGHAWIQRGAELSCKSCPFEHTSYLPPQYQLYGIQEDGIPKLRKIGDNSMAIPKEAKGKTVAEYRKLTKR